MVTGPETLKDNSLDKQTLANTSKKHSQAESAKYVTFEPYSPTFRAGGRGTNKSRKYNYQKPHQTVNDQLFAYDHKPEYKRYYVMNANYDANLWKM